MIVRTRLPNGVRVLTEAMPHVRSATIGIFVDVGSSAEPAHRRGISHMLEHMLFKGTGRRTARTIAETMDGIGGVLNAATDKESTVFYAHVIDKQLPLAIDVLSDMFLHSRVDAEDLAREQSVVLEEIKMYDDSPEDVIGESFARTFWPHAQLGDPVIGYAHTVKAIDRATLVGWMAERYSPATVLIAAAGNIDHDAVIAQLGDAFAEFGGTAVRPEPESPTFHAGHSFIEDDTEQAYLMLGMPGLSLRDERRYTLAVLDTILGGGMSSRLFQEVRESRGLAYEVGTFQTGYREAGLFGVSVGTSPERAQECIDVINAEIDRLLADGVSDAEVVRARDHLKGNITLSLESTSSRMSRLARNEIVYGYDITPEDVEAAFDLVTMSDVSALARSLFPRERRGLCVLGPAALGAVHL